jgi:hypothetical protein
MEIHRYFVIIAIGLSGCATQTNQPQAGESGHCASVAATRANDAAVNGYDQDTQKRIYDSTVQDCLKWSKKSTYNDYGKR